MAGLAARKRGRKALPADIQGQQVLELERDNAQLRQRLLQAESIIDVPKKVSFLLGIDPSPLAYAERP